MGGITSNVGLFSGINTGELIEQLIASQSRPKTLAQRRLVQLQGQQAAYLDINSRLNAFKTAAGAFRVNNIFDGRLAASSDDAVLTASAGNTAVNGSYNFVVDRLVTTQQMLSRGFSNRNDSPLGLPSITFESPAARLDRDTDLNTLNNNEGISRGRIVVNGTDVDLSRVATVGELLDAINEADLGVTASVSNGAFVLDGVTSLANKSGSNVLSSLGLSSPAIIGDVYTGTQVYGLGTNTSLMSLNDGRGVDIRETSGIGVDDFTITVGAGTAIKVRIGEIERMVDDVVEVVEGAVSTMGGVVQRINAALTEAGQTGVSASIDQATGSIRFANTTGQDITIANAQVGGNDASTTAEDLGIAGTFAAGSFSGSRVLAGLNTTLVSSLNGGRGLSGTDGQVTFATRDGASFTVDVSGATTTAELIDLINNDSGNAGRVTVGLDRTGRGLSVADNTAGGNTFEISGTFGVDAAAALGISGTFASGTASGANLQMAYLGRSTTLSSLNRGEGIGLGRFQIVDSNALTGSINITASDKTLGDVIDRINGAGLAVRARINDTGDGIMIEESGSTPGGSKIRITDTEGSVGRKLRIVGEATDTGAQNRINGSYEQTIDFEPNATLSDVISTINNADAGVRATVINDGSGVNPFRISLVSDFSGQNGRFLVDTGDFDLGLSQIEAGQNARIFYGSSDPAKAILVSNSTNTVDGLIDGVSINLKRTSETPVTLSITTNTDEIETRINGLVEAFNGVISRIDFQTRYNDETKEKGPLLGDGTLQSLRGRMFEVLRATNDGFTDTFDRLSQVGISVGAGGKMTFNAGRFREAYAQDPDAVEQLFTRRDIRPVDGTANENGAVITDPDRPIEFEALGVVSQLERLADGYVSTIGGTLQNRNNALTSQITLQQDRIASIDRTLDVRREILQRQFLAMERAIAGFQSQSSALGQISLIG